VSVEQRTSTPSLTVERLLQSRSDAIGLPLELLSGSGGLDRSISSPHIQKTGLALAGFHEYLRPARVLVFGESEMSYLEGLDHDARVTMLSAMFAHEIPCVLITGGGRPPVDLLSASDQIAVFWGFRFARAALGEKGFEPMRTFLPPMAYLNTDARNAYLADPDFLPQPTERMTSDAYAAERRAAMPKDRAMPSDEVRGGLGLVPAGHGTTARAFCTRSSTFLTYSVTSPIRSR